MIALILPMPYMYLQPKAILFHKSFESHSVLNNVLLLPHNVRQNRFYPHYSNAPAFTKITKIIRNRISSHKVVTMNLWKRELTFLSPYFYINRTEIIITATLTIIAFKLYLINLSHQGGWAPTRITCYLTCSSGS